MSSADGKLSRKVSIASFRKSLSSLSLSTLSNLNFIKNFDLPKTVITSSSLPAYHDGVDTPRKPLNETSCYDYPGRVGESILNSRFKLVRKLGKGNYSTVWLARDEKSVHSSTLFKSSTQLYLCLRQADYVALKILTNRATNCHAMRMTDEVSILKIISSSDPSHPGFLHTITLFDHFSLQSMHGEHLGLAFNDVLGQSICDLRRRTPTYTLSLEVVQRVLKQVLLALAYVHDCCKIIHTGMYLLISSDLSITELHPRSEA